MSESKMYQCDECGETGTPYHVVMHPFNWYKIERSGNILGSTHFCSRRCLKKFTDDWGVETPKKGTHE